MEENLRGEVMKGNAWVFGKPSIRIRSEIGFPFYLATIKGIVQ